MVVGRGRERPRQIGEKVVVKGAESDGVAELVSIGPETSEIAFFTGPETAIHRRVSNEALLNVSLPSESRCYYRSRSGFLAGRVVALMETDAQRAYHVRFPNEKLSLLKETEFRVRSYVGRSHPPETLATLAHETPFFFDRRQEWISNYVLQASAWRGLSGLCSAKVEVFPHQVDVVRRVLHDPIVRYLLADEVGLGKTIEAGSILRQLRLDAPGLRIVVLTPEPLVSQWTEELRQRFELREGVAVLAHSNIEECDRIRPDIIVIDEAHRLVTGDEATRHLFEVACRVSSPVRTPHLLLLSATPVLHYEKELLALLHLLDPETHQLDQLEAFTLKMAKRRDLGQALLAISRATKPSFILRHVQRCAELIPDDTLVAHIAKEVTEAARSQATEELRVCASRLQIHLTETYRVHRRMLRTRRSSLLDCGDFVQRRAEESPEYEADDDEIEAKLRRMWDALNEWRVHVSANCGSSEARELAIKTYLALGQALTSDRVAVRAIVDARKRACVTAQELELLADVLVSARDVGHRSRHDALERILTLGDDEKWLVFCGSQTTAAEVASFLKGHVEGTVLTATAASNSSELSRALRSFSESSGRTILLADSVIEEGMNLQVADGLVFFDLPFSPMRLEQRVGRLDRLNRTRDVRIAAVLSVDDPETAFDAAWYAVLRDGFQLFAGTVSDLQFLVEQEQERLAEIAFNGGPSALVAQCERLRQRAAEEREAAAEQDILDGLYSGDLKGSALWLGIEAAEEREDAFTDSLVTYLKENVGLATTRREGAKTARSSEVLSIGVHPKHDPLVPADVLVGFGSSTACVYSGKRTVATQNATFQLLRPGHPLVECARRLAEWDDRGQAFAIWRPTVGFTDPALVFRISVFTRANLEPVRDAMERLRWNAVSQGALLRLVQGWLPPSICDAFLDSDGVEVSPEMASRCSARYDGKRDVNLGGERSRVLLELTGEATWPSLCEHAANRAVQLVRSSEVFRNSLSAAQRAADEHFETIAARLRAREKLAVDSDAAVSGERQALSTLRELVASLLHEPDVRVESIGLYVLSQERPWQA